MKTAVWMVLLAGSAAAQEDVVALSRLGAQFYAHADYRNAELKLREALALASDSQARAGILFDLGAVLRIESRLPEAESFYQSAIAARAPDSPDQARPLAGLALVQMTEGRIAEAIENAERAVRLSGDNVLWSAAARNTLCTLLLLRGQAARAETVERNIAERLKLAGASESEEYVDALTNLASSRLVLGNLAQAAGDLREAETVALRIAGPDHPLTAMVWNNLGKILAASGDAKRAEGLFQRAIAAWRASLGPGHPDVACGLVNLAALAQGRKQFAAADRLYRQAIAIDEAALGSDSLTVANYWNDLGALAEAQHHHRQAEAAIAKGLAIAEMKAGPNHPDTARMAVNLAIVLYAEAKYTQACGLFTGAVPVKERILGPDSAELASILRIYASSLRAIHDYVNAESTDLRATRIITRNALAGKNTVN